MSTRLQLLILGALLLLILLIVRAVRSRKLEFRLSLPWLLVLLALVVLDLFPGLASAVAKLCGFELPVNLLTFCGLAFALILIFGLSTALSHLNERQKQLIQQVALLEKQLEEMHRE